VSGGIDKGLWKKSCAETFIQSQPIPVPEERHSLAQDVSPGSDPKRGTSPLRTARHTLHSNRFFSALILFLGLTTSCYHGSRPKRVGEVAPDFSLQDSAQKITLNQFRGQVVVLNFWATWCPPCVEELPSLMSMQERARRRGVVVLGISIDVDEDAYHRFLKQRNVNFLSVRDPERKVAKLYGVHGWPETYIIDRQGLVRRKIIGPVDWTSSDVLDLLNKL
jgi:cytochrome c biogenesis protein CcmG, thiol:disulfide interchange protein DsbE